MLKTWLTSAMGTRGRVEVLRALYRLPETYSGSARSIARMAAMDHRVAQRALDDLVATGVVRVRTSPAANFFNLHPAHPMYGALRETFAAEARQDEQIQDAVVSGLKGHSVPLSRAYLFGSFARGHDVAGSDIDIAIVLEAGRGDAHEGALDDLAQELRDRFGVGFHFVVADRPLEEMARAEVNEMGFWHQVATDAVEMSGA